MTRPQRRSRSFAWSVSLAVALCLFVSVGSGQRGDADGRSTAAAAPPNDALGRNTPRGTVLGFMDAARSGRLETASEYLDTRLRGKAASDLAYRLYVVLDRRLESSLARL